MCGNLNKIYCIVIFLLLFNFVKSQNQRVTYYNDKIEFLTHQTHDFSKTLDSLVSNGFYTLKIDSIQEEKNKKKIFIQLGKKFKNYEYILDDDSKNVFQKSDYQSFIIDNLLNKIKNHYENLGFPFVEVKSKTDVLKNQVFITTKKREKRTINELIYNKKIKIPSSYKKEINQLFVGKEYSKNNLQKISEFIKKNEFINQIENPKVLFTIDSTKIYLYTQNKKNSNFDGILGINTNNQNQTRLTGNVSLNLINIFGGFEKIALNWNSSAIESSELAIKLQFPYLMKNYLGSETEIRIFKQDSTYANTFLKQKLFHRIALNKQIGFSTLYENSNYVIVLNPSLDFQDYQKTGFGIHYNQQNRRNSRIFPFNEQFEINAYSLTNNREIDGKLNQYSLEIRYEKLFSLFKQKHFIYLKSLGFSLLSDVYQQNELKRIGGLKTIRGFNEDVFFADTYLLNQLEYRYLSSDDLYFSIFSDFGWIQNKQINIQNNLLSFGLGFSFLNKFGLFSFQYAIGKTNEIPFDFQQSKIHIGITSYF